MKEISLDGIWKLRADRIEDNPFGIKERMEWNMNIPGDVHDTLIKNNTIPDPYYGMNELDIQFIGRGDWTIYRTFDWKDIHQTGKGGYCCKTFYQRREGEGL